MRSWEHFLMKNQFRHLILRLVLNNDWTHFNSLRGAAFPNRAMPRTPFKVCVPQDIEEPYAKWIT